MFSDWNHCVRIAPRKERDPGRYAIAFAFFDKPEEASAFCKVLKDAGAADMMDAVAGQMAQMMSTISPQQQQMLQQQMGAISPQQQQMMQQQMGAMSPQQQQMLQQQMGGGVPPPGGAVPTAGGAGFCGKCGTAFAPDNAFCTSCGSPKPYCTK